MSSRQHDGLLLLQDSWQLARTAVGTAIVSAGPSALFQLRACGFLAAFLPGIASLQTIALFQMSVLRREEREELLVKTGFPT